MWFEEFGLVDVFVPEFRFAGDSGFKNEGNEVFDALALYNGLGTFFVDGDVEFPLAGGEERVGFLVELEVFLGEYFAKRVGLQFGEGGGVGVNRGSRCILESHIFEALWTRIGFVAIFGAGMGSMPGICHGGGPAIRMRFSCRNLCCSRRRWRRWWIILSAG